ncbi:MAG TPA: hypothetical protein VGL81_21330 [Polyangiaceae bacterium]|jgi:hypothetical protein
MPASHPLRHGLPAALFATFLLVACGARGPLDIDVIEIVEGPEGGADVAVEASADAADASDSGDAADAAEETQGFDGGPIVNCGSCVVQSCGQQLLTCLTSTTCRTALQCVVTMCISGGAPDISCVTGCANGDATALGDLLGAFGCIVETCGTQCTSVLGGLTGGGGSGGGGGGG